jgi:hypothetical protein
MLHALVRVTMGNKESHGCCAPTGYSMSESVVVDAPVQCVWETLLHPEYELELLRKRHLLGDPSTFVEPTLVVIHRAETGPVHRGSQWSEVRREPPRPDTLCCGVVRRHRRKTIELRITVTDTQIDIESNSYSVSYSMGTPKTKDMDLQHGIFVKTVSLQPCNLTADASVEHMGESVSVATDHEKCLAVITQVFHVGSFYGCLQELCCKGRVERLALSYLHTVCGELKVVSEMHLSSARRPTSGMTTPGVSGDASAVESGPND